MRKNLLLLSLGVSLGLSGALMAADTTRSLPAAPGGDPAAPTAGVVFGKTTYVQPQPGGLGMLYMGISKTILPPVAPAADNRVYTLARGVDGDVTPMVQLPLNLNNAKQADLSSIYLPISQNLASQLTVNNVTLLNNQFPVMTVNGNAAVDPITQIWVFVTSASPLNILTNVDEEINDAGGNAIDHPIQAIATAITPAASTTPYIFAAVSEAGKEFKTVAGAADGINRGIAVLRIGNTLNVLDVNALSPAVIPVPNPRARRLPLDLVGIFAFVPNPAPVNAIKKAELASNDVTMFYDNAYIKRLYIGLSGVKRDDPTKEGGVLSLAMGVIVTDAVTGKDNSLEINPIVADPITGLPIKAQFYEAGQENNTNGIVGFYADGVSKAASGFANDGDRDIAFSTRHIRTLHTTTGYDYVIVHTIVRSSVAGAGGLLIGDNITNQVYALPVAPASVADTGFVGQIVQVDRANDGTPVGYVPATGVYTPVPPTNYANMPIATDNAAKVGAGLNLQIVDGTYIEDMMVYGDAVYVVLAGPNNLNAGIYQSSAIFNGDGFIRAWTPWQRVMGDMRRVLGMGLSTIDGTYTFLTPQYRTDLTTPNDFDTVRATEWGKTEDVTAQDQAVENAVVDDLSSLLTTLFPQAEGGVLSIQSFDEYTPGFKHGRFAMMVALGTSKVALIQTGEFVGGTFVPVPDFTLNQNVFVFDAKTPRGAALGAIAPLTCAEVSRIGFADDAGWLFVGGRNGLAVLSLDANGNGFTSNTDAGGGLTALLPDDVATHNAFPGGTNWSFKQLYPAAGNTFARTRKLAAAHGYLGVMTFNAGYLFGMDNPKFTLAAPVALAETVVPTPPNVRLNDMLVVQGDAASGVDDRVLAATTDGIWYTNPADPVALARVALPATVIARLAYVGQDRTTTPAFGNLYALVQNLVSDKDSVQRFDVKATGAGVIGLVLQAADVVAITENAKNSYIDFNQSRSGIFPDGSFLYSTRSEDFGETEFLKLHNITDTAATTATYDLTNSLDVNVKTNVLVDGLVREGATGTLMLPADWGVRVNQ